MEEYTITLADGRQLTGLLMNGTNFVSRERVDEAIFENNLSTMTVSDGESETIYHNVELIQQAYYDNDPAGWYLAFREKTAQELAFETIKQNADGLTDLQLALAEVYELILGGV